ncbi:MAG: dipeptidase [Verrucomicrobia bacterium]|nr:dipeptidase [Verrucomicrobiota bacterium]
MSIRSLLFLGLSCAVARAESEAELAARARAVHERLMVLDTHLDTPANLKIPGWDILQEHAMAVDGTQVDYPRMRAGGLDGGFWAIFTAQGPLTPEGRARARDAALLTALRIHKMVAAHPAEFELALKADDAARIAAAGKRIVYVSIENAYPIGQDLTLVKTFYDLGVRVLSPVHVLHNDLADSGSDSKPKPWGGLSPLGKQLVAECNRLGILLDASHASDEVLDQMMALSKTPIILTHSGVSAVFKHPRNIDDDRLRRLAASGGVIQMNALSAYLVDTPPNPDRNKAMGEMEARYTGRGELSPEMDQQRRRERREIMAKFPVRRATFDDFMAQVLHALKVVGPQHVGFGADWDGGGGVIGMEDVASYGKVTEALLKAGYSEQDLAAIWGGNALRVLRAAEDYAAKVRAAEPAKRGT